MDINGWTIAGVVIGAIAVLVAVYFGVRTLRRQFPKRELRYTVQATPLLNSNPAAAHYDLRVLLSGRELRDPYAVTVSFESRSRADIPSSSFDAARPILITADIPLHVSTGSEVGPKSIGIEWNWLGNRGDGTMDGTIAPQLIRPKATGFFNALTDGMPKITVDSSLVDIVVRDSAHTSDSSRSWLFAGAGVLTGMAVALGTSLVTYLLQM